MTRKQAKVRVLLPSLQKDTAASPFRFTGKMPDMREHSATLHGCSDTRWLLLAIRYPAIGPGWRDGMQFDQLTRREVMSLLGGAAAWPPAARAQQSGDAVIGILSSGAPNAFFD